ncbi:MAG: 16S rRNA (adenine(1518)-N(6)/adenine(1519)-N(6))-dimethyltransferase RsmA, partial [Vicinamibacterales bacterium]
MRPPRGSRLPARKRFGQHFLEPAWAAKVVRSIAPQREDVFLEIGPGRAALTRPLAAAVRRVIAIEIDRDLAAQLVDLDLPRVAVVTSDVLEVSKARIQQELQNAGEDPAADIRVAGNLPYNVASPILFRLQEMFLAGLPIVDATVMLQREVADRLTAGPGSRDYGVLSVLTGIAAGAERLLELPPGAFRPPPKVRSTVVRLRFRAPDP